METSKVIDIKQFMALLHIKSQTTFNKRAEAAGFPVAIEWPPSSRRRGWIRKEVDEYLEAQLENATRWPDVPERPLAGAVKDRQNGQQSAVRPDSQPTPAS